MSNISHQHTPPPTLLLTHQGNGQYQVSTSGGSKNALPGGIPQTAPGTTQSAADLNVMLRQTYGVQLNANGQLSPVDHVSTRQVSAPTTGATRDASAAAQVATGFGMPSLPDPPRSNSAPAQVFTEAEASAIIAMQGPGVSMAVFQLLRASQDDQLLQRKLRISAQSTQLQAKAVAIDSAAKKLVAEREAAVTNFATTLAVVAVTAAATAVAGVARAGVGGIMIVMLASQLASQLTQASVTLWSKTAGPQREADDLGIRERRQELVGTYFEQTGKEFDDGFSSAKEAFRQAIETVKMVEQNRSQEVQKIHS